MKSHINKFLFYLFSWLIFLMCTYNAEASIRLTVSSAEGTNSLRFGRIDTIGDTSKEIRIRVNTNENKQYQIFQRIVEPLINERGETLDRDVILAAQLPGSNSSGTVYMQIEECLSSSEKLVYASSPEGVSDSFILIYHINQQEITTTGNFTGRILFTARAVDGSAIDEVILNVFFDIAREFYFETEVSSGLNSLMLDFDNINQEEYVHINLLGNRGENIKISQEVIVEPVDELNNKFDLDLIIFRPESLSFSAGDSEMEHLSMKKSLIYSDNENSDSLRIFFLLDERAQHNQTAGNYSGRLRYYVQQGQYSKEYDVDLKIQIKPIFNLKLDYPKNGMTFLEVLPYSAPQIKEIEVTINTNTGRPYVVTQNSMTDLMNDRGCSIDKDHFLIKQELSSQSKGKIQFPDFQPFKEGDVSLFYSDEKGTPVKFKVYYKLIPYQKMEPGSYSVSIVYSLHDV